LLPTIQAVEDLGKGSKWNRIDEKLIRIIGYVGLATLVIMCGAGNMRTVWDFRHMTPSEHLAAARHLKESADLGNLHEALRHLEPVRTAEAATLRTEVGNKIMDLEETETQTRAQQQASWEQEKAAQTAAERNAALDSLATDLKSLGYDFSATASNATMSFASRDFSDTARRVAFLSLVRDHAAKACETGFADVQLAASGWPAFSETYSLNCSAPSWWQKLISPPRAG
jgi:hypothetical protein